MKGFYILMYETLVGNGVRANEMLTFSVNWITMPKVQKCVCILDTCIGSCDHMDSYDR